MLCNVGQITVVDIRVIHLFKLLLSLALERSLLPGDTMLSHHFIQENSSLRDHGRHHDLTPLFIPAIFPEVAQISFVLIEYLCPCIAIEPSEGVEELVRKFFLIVE